ncbi:hypothetical protein LOD99_13111 [Oopsacas minuta]|uniref:Ubiquitin carboxyl-terminal hydrolase MINDY n=1 Tax=Oopsacas minuta TaxID=111878 RepID=A0AAV7JAX7_9METZ|nr:hypothetical protein LOD99_13111 [Oopsacas minuta]
MQSDNSNGQTADIYSIEVLCSSLIKEFLVRRGLKQTLTAFSQECKTVTTGQVLSSRKELAQAVGMEDAMRRNKSTHKPLSTILEVLVRNVRHAITNPSISTKPFPLTHSSSSLPHNNTDIKRNIATSRHDSATAKSTLVNGSFAIPQKQTQFLRTADTEISSLDTARSVERETLELFIPTLRTQSICLEDLDDLDLNSIPTTINTHLSHRPSVPSHPISYKEAVSLRNIVFGSSTGRSFNHEWKRQGFFFCDLPGIEFGLIQLKGGPCGLLAVIQAHIVKYLLFHSDETAEKALTPKGTVRKSALRHAMAEVLWRAGGHKCVSVVLPAASPYFGSNSGYKSDQLTECLQIHQLRGLEELNSFLEYNLDKFMNQNPGCILFLYSALLSRGVSAINKDMDSGSLMLGAHGYCTQELVNLLLTGRAVSNVFNGDMQLNTGGDMTMLLKGIPSVSEIGMLSLFEHYGSCTVGSNLKEPEFPIWVVCSESHFTVLFNTNRNLLKDWRLEKKFDLLYYDGLSRQEEQIRLTVDTKTAISPQHNSSLIPPLELCIRTKWNRAVISWNDADPIL